MVAATGTGGRHSHGIQPANSVGAAGQRLEGELHRATDARAAAVAVAAKVVGGDRGAGSAAPAAAPPGQNQKRRQCGTRRIGKFEGKGKWVARATVTELVGRAASSQWGSASRAGAPASHAG